MKTRHIRFVVAIAAFVVVATGITINWSQKQCPTRAYFPDDAFPAQTRLLDTQHANAVAQWTRKYNLPCQTCHTAFPRLNYYGELFQRNGYQLPGEQDGDSTKTEVNDHLFIDKVGNLLGFRISFTPVEVTTKALTVNGSTRLRYNFGAANWLQFFVAGSIFKNASIFIEAELPGENPTAYSATGIMHPNWFTLGYHNIFKTSWLNIRTGKLSMLNWAAQSGRLRMIPNINTQATRMQTSPGVAGAEDSIRYSEPIPAIEIYGYNKYFLYSVGVSNGAKFTDANQYKNFFGTLRLELPETDFAGSAITASGLYGHDSLTSTTAQIKNKFYTFAGGVNLRWKDKLDFIGEYIWEKEYNFNLTAGYPTNRRYGITGQLGYLMNPEWFFALQYDYVTGQTWTADTQYNKISENITYMPRENFRLNLTLRQELKSPPTGKQNEFLLNVRAMF